MINISHSSINDLEEIKRIYAHAREQMKISNNPQQWKDSEPSIEKIVSAISSKNHYKIENDGRICGVFSLFHGKDPTYSNIEGAWLNDDKYVTIHSLASDNTVKGILSIIMKYAFSISKTVRIDTHENNSIMRHLLDKLGFTYCGIIYLSNGEQRLAYMKTIS